jgi:hypothetical protein
MVSRPPENIRSTATAEPDEKHVSVHITYKKKNPYRESSTNPEQGSRALETVLVVLPTTEEVCMRRSPHVGV